MQLVERRAGYALYCYGVRSWALFSETKLNKDGEQVCIVNGEFENVFEKYRQHTQPQPL